jgi:hypothetical protein
VGLDTVPVLAEVVEGRFSRIEIIEPQSQQVRNS